MILVVAAVVIIVNSHRRNHHHHNIVHSPCGSLCSCVAVVDGGWLERAVRRSLSDGSLLQYVTFHHRPSEWAVRRSRKSGGGGTMNWWCGGGMMLVVMIDCCVMLFYAERSRGQLMIILIVKKCLSRCRRLSSVYSIYWMRSCQLSWILLIKVVAFWDFRPINHSLRAADRLYVYFHFARAFAVPYFVSYHFAV